MSNFEGAKLFAEYGWSEKKLGKRESASGPGSSISSSLKAKSLILDTIKEKGVKRILDLGCGDWHWMSTIRDKFSDAYYEGWDANEEMVAHLNSTYGNENTKFLVKDIVDNSYEHFDLVICRDVLFHMAFENSQRVLKNIDDAGIENLITTCFLGVTENTNIKTYNHIQTEWGFYKINLNIEPFNMLECLVKSVDEGVSTDGYSRSICLYSIS